MAQESAADAGRERDLMDEENAIQEAKPRKGQYTELALAAKAEGISRIVKNRRALARTDKVDLNNLEDVKRICAEYETNCEVNGLLPNFSGLCSCLGISRAWAYLYISQNGDSETARFFDLVRTRWASMREDAMSAGCADTAASIFLLKNSNLGYSDKNEIKVEATAPDPRANRPAWAYGLSDEEWTQKIIESIPDED